MKMIAHRIALKVCILSPSIVLNTGYKMMMLLVCGLRDCLIVAVTSYALFVG